ncbi:50S ribosomal protein L37e [archaeon]|jgi:large subunit ribosomal protein L37e|nr:50S ribosomal protein L37e [archaeon]MBT4351842.1 50S ribosomal protein L37e [archaeon]MBT4647613.1 50S ribosomal protein L37e [archaeon]MBT6822589.1 50S ribosomal protein L37e [archaeon]MBT7392774.1 50S ribosomal protein L37e [archaeon]
MGTGTAAQGKRSGKTTHMHCRRCGKKAYHMKKKKCSSCGFGVSARIRDYNWKKTGKKVLTKN